MHVDDFIAMENNSSPSDSQGKQPIKVCLKVVFINIIVFNSESCLIYVAQ